jgi:hypothetical protein
VDEPLGVLVLPSRLEGFSLQAHARDLLSVPRVVALEPSRVRTPRFMREAAAMRQGRRLRFPGAVRLVVLYNPAQYRLARALLSHHAQAELWYVPPIGGGLQDAHPADIAELPELDDLARQHAVATLTAAPDGSVADAALRARLRELGIISPYAFSPRGRLSGR